MVTIFPQDPVSDELCQFTHLKNTQQVLQSQNVLTAGFDISALLYAHMLLVRIDCMLPSSLATIGAYGLIIIAIRLIWFK